MNTIMFNVFKKLLVNVLSFCLVFIFTNSIFSQNDSIKHESIQSDNTKSIDSLVIKGFSVFSFSNDEINPDFFLFDLPFFLYHYIPNNNLYLSIGTLGSFKKSLLYKPENRNNFFDIYSNYNHLIINPIEEVFYTSTLPISNAYYSMGPNREQVFQVYHTQPIDTNTNIGIRYSLLNIPGVFQNQKSDITRLFGYVSHLSPNTVHTSLLSFSFNKIQLNENGGLANPTQFENDFSVDKQFLQTRLQSAENRFKSNHFLFQHILKIPNTKNRYSLYAGYLGTLSTYNRVYQDLAPDSSYYSDFIMNNTITYDSLFTRVFSNSFYISNYTKFSEPPARIMCKFGLKHSYANNQLFDIKQQFHQFEMFGNAAFHIDSLWDFRANLAYKFGQFQKNDFCISTHLKRSFNNKKINFLSISSEYFVQEPQFYYQSYMSNHYVWENQFNKEMVFSLNGTMSTTYGNITLSTHRIKNYLYFSSIIIPYQYEGNIQIFNAYYDIKKNINQLFLHVIGGMQVVNKSQILRLPEYYAQLQTGYQFPMFRGAMDAFVGIETFWFSRYYADIWSPVLMQFYTQNHTQIGNYLYPNIFIAGNIKRARLFVMLENITEGVSKKNFYAMPTYPRSGRIFRWGVSWTFIN